MCKPRGLVSGLEKNLPTYPASRGSSEKEVSLRIRETLLSSESACKEVYGAALDRVIYGTRDANETGPNTGPMRTSVTVETKGPPDTKYGRTVCRRAVSESLHRRFVHPTRARERKRERRSGRSRWVEERARATSRRRHLSLHSIVLDDSYAGPAPEGLLIY